MSESIRILIVEDFPPDVELAEREINKTLESCVFRFVETREDYLTAIEKFQPDLIISDYRMPHFDGLAALRLAQERVPLTPVIILTGSMNEDTAVECMKKGATDYVIKEHIKRLGHAVIHALEEKQLRKERHRAENALRASEERFRSLYENATIGIYRTTPEGRILMANPAAVRMLGFDSFDELVQRDLEKSRFKPSYKRDEFHQRLESEGVITGLENTWIKKDGSTIYVRESVRAIRDGKDNVLYYDGTFEDITERKQAEEALLESSTFNQLLVETMPFGIDIVDKNGTILFLNNTMKALVSEDVLGQQCWSIYKDDKKQCNDCPLRQGIEFGKSKILEVAGVLGRKTFQISHVGMMYKGRKAMLEVFQDITEQKKLQNELFQAQKLQSIGTLAGGIAHDFNNILCIILAYVSSMRRLKLSPENTLENLNAISRAVQRGAALVRQVLTFARKTDAVTEVVDINSLVLELLSMLKRTFPQTITFSEQLGKNLPFIVADHSQMHQALLNLCVNARDAMPNGGTIIVKTESLTKECVAEKFPSASYSNYVCISVTDTGEGMDETIRQKAFDPFFTTKEKGKGTGLGLSVVYGIMKAHDGLIDLESVPGKGTAFRLYFPVPVTTDESPEYLQPDEMYDTGGKETILLVEGEDVLLETVRINLESYGYTVIVAKDGKAAVEMYNRYRDKLDLVITDMGLPGITGMDEFRNLKMINPDLKIILASGYIDPDFKSELLKQGVSDFIQKPYRLEDVLKIIRNAMD